MAEFFFIPSPILFPPTNPRPRWGTDVRATFLGGGGYCGSGCCIVAAVFEERALPCFRGNGGTKTKTTTQTKRNGTTHSLHGSCLERHRGRERERERDGSYRDLVFTSFRLLILRPRFRCSTRKKGKGGTSHSSLSTPLGLPRGTGRRRSGVAFSLVRFRSHAHTRTTPLVFVPPLQTRSPT